MTPFGDRALRFDIPRATGRASLRRALSGIAGVSDVVLSETIGAVIFTAGARPDPAAIERALALAALAPALPGVSRTIHVAYDGEDIDAVAGAIRRSRDDVVRIHAEAEYRVAMLGFLPGFAYLRGLAAPLHLPRRAPRTRVPAGSVAIAAQYTGIYPFASPGGWHLLGRAVDFTPFGPKGAVLADDDVVHFAPTRDAPPPLALAPIAPPSSAPPPAPPYLEIARAAGIALLVDRGRSGRMHEGIPPGGPLVRSALERANAFVANDSLACAVEISGALEVVARGGTMTIADEDGSYALAPDERHVVATAGRTRTRYLAVAGGIDAPLVLGGRGALLAAGIGRLLRRGDRIAAAPSAAQAPSARETRPNVGADAPIPVLEGPDRPPGFSFGALASASFRIAAASDRTGTRLEGGPRGADADAMSRPSLPMVVGAIELTPSGLIVLGPDHPTTGGYPVVAVVASDALDAIFSRPIGASVRFAARW